MPSTAPPARHRRTRTAWATTLLAALLVGPAAALTAPAATAAPTPHVPVVTVSPANPTPDDDVTVTSTITGCAGATWDPIVIYMVRGPHFENDYYSSGSFTDGGDTYTVSRTFPAGTFPVGSYTAESYGAGEPCYPPMVDDYFYSAQVPFTVAYPKAATTVVGTDAGGAVTGQPATAEIVVDSASATGTVTVTESGTVRGTGTVSGGSAQVTLTGLTAGVHQLVAEYAGDDAHLASTSAAFAVTVARAASPLLVSAPASALRGDGVRVDVTAPAGAGGTFSVSEGGTTLSAGNALTGGVGHADLTGLAAGTHDLLVSYGGSTEHEPSTATASVSVTLRPTTTALTVTRSGSDLTLSAVVAADAGWATAPAGSVRFSDGADVLATVPLVDGIADLPVPGAAAGAHALTAQYLGDGTTGASTSATAVAVVPALSAATQATAGGTLRVQASGLAAGSQAVVLLDGVQVGTLVADGDGEVDGSVVVPDGVSGLLRLRLEGVDAEGEPVVLEQDVLVAAASAPAGPSVIPVVTTPVAQPVVAAAPSRRSDAALPRTGAGDTAALGLLGAAFLVSGAVLVGRSRRPVRATAARRAA